MTNQPSATSVERITRYVAKFWEKTGTSPHPDPEMARTVIGGLALHLDELGRPVCPCNFYPDKKKELEKHGKRWICACDEMKKYKYCHCLLFVTPEGLPITEYLPEGHEGRVNYGQVLDPAPGKGREGK